MTNGLFDLTGKVVVVTGGNAGLGLGFAQGCALQNADVVVWGRRADRNQVAVDTLSALGSGRVDSAVVDVSVEEEVRTAFEAAVERFGRVDCVFVNAGVSSVAPSFADMTSEAWHKLLAVNQHGAFYTLREACRHMRDRALGGDPGGSIVLCGSLSIFGGTKGLEHYAASKGALAAMLKGVAVEMGEYAVRANMIAFGLFATEAVNAQTLAQVEQGVVARTPLKRIGQLDDVHGIAAYLASNASQFMTGQIIALDGGRTAMSR